jgi:hypothetical protein
MINFGVGQLVINPGGATPTPVQLAILQDVDLDVSFNEKELIGQFQLPVDVARGEAKWTMKAKEAQISSLLIGSYLAGSSSAANYVSSAINESGTVPAAPTYTITVANSAAFVADCGVVDLTAGMVLSRGAAAAAGVYSEAAGVYTFDASAASHVVWISYTYSVTGSGKTIHFNNQLMGQGVMYSATLYNIFRTKVIGWKFYAVTMPKLTLPFKNNDYTIAGIDLSIYQDSMGNVCEYYESDF